MPWTHTVGTAGGIFVPPDEAGGAIGAVGLAVAGPGVVGLGVALLGNVGYSDIVRTGLKIK